jgi:hypothetical protein
MMKWVAGFCLAAMVAVAAAGGTANSAGQLPLHRGCPPGNKRTPYPPARFDEAVAAVKRVVYGQRYTIQGQTVVTTPRNSPLVAAMWVDGRSSLIPGMRTWYKVMQRRCGQHTPYLAWAFEFAIPTNAPDFSPYFVVKTARAWHVF